MSQNRWTTYVDTETTVAPGWRLDTVVAPSRLGGANGIVWSPDDRLMVTQVFGSQVTAIEVRAGTHQVYAPLGGGIAAPDDGAFGYDGTFFATEPMNATVSARQPDGTYRTLRDDLPAANGMTVSTDGRRLFVDEFRPGGRLLELDPAGEKAPTVLAEDLAMPNAFAMGPDGALWFPQVLAGEIWRYDLDTKTLERRFTDLATPTAVKFDRSGRLLTSEGAAGRLTRIDLATGARETLAQVNPGIDNFAIAADGRLFVSHFTYGRVAEVTGGVERVLSPSGLIGPFGLEVTTNTGSAFSMLQGSSTLVFVVDLLIVAVLGIVAVRASGWPMQIGLGLMLGGAIGNLVDRVVHHASNGGVIDFITFPHFATFNAADSAITIGVIVILVCLLADLVANRRQEGATRAG